MLGNQFWLFLQCYTTIYRFILIFFYQKESPTPPLRIFLKEIVWRLNAPSQWTDNQLVPVLLRVQCRDCGIQKPKLFSLGHRRSRQDTTIVETLLLQCTRLVTKTEPKTLFYVLYCCILTCFNIFQFCYGFLQCVDYIFKVIVSAHFFFATQCMFYCEWIFWKFL